MSPRRGPASKLKPMDMDKTESTPQVTFHSIIQPWLPYANEVHCLARSRVLEAAPHGHDIAPSHLVKLIGVKSGQQTFQVGERILTASRSQVLIVPAHTPVTTRPFLLSRIEAYEVYFVTTLPWPFLGGSFWTVLRERLDALQAEVVDVPMENILTLERLYELAHTARGDALRVVEAIGMTALFLVDLLGAIDRKRPASENEAVPFIEETIAYMRANLGERMTTASLVARSGYSETAFIEAFKRKTGATPMDFLMRLRIDAACQRLAETHDSVTKIGHCLGFSSTQYFATAFRRYMATTPTEFRSRRTGARNIR